MSVRFIHGDRERERERREREKERERESGWESVKEIERIA